MSSEEHSGTTSTSSGTALSFQLLMSCLLSLAWFVYEAFRHFVPLSLNIGRTPVSPPVFQEIFIPDCLSHMPHPLHSCSDWPVSGIYSPCTNPYVIRAGGPRSSYISLRLFPPPSPFPLLTFLLLTKLASFLLLTRLLLRLLRSVA